MTEKYLCKDCDYIHSSYNDKVTCRLHDKRAGLLDTPCNDFKLRKYIIVDYCGEESVKNTLNNVVYVNEYVAQRLGDLEHELVKYQKELINEGHLKHLEIQSTLAGYASQYPRDSSEFNLISSIANDLGITISLFGASDDD